MAKGNYKIPFLKGVPQVYVHPHVTSGVDWRENTPFVASLVFDRFTRGRSAARAVFRHETTGVPYEMFLTDLEDAMTYMTEGKLHGRFEFVKRGSNYGVQLLSSGPLTTLAAQAE